MSVYAIPQDWKEQVIDATVDFNESDQLPKLSLPNPQDHKEKNYLGGHDSEVLRDEVRRARSIESDNDILSPDKKFMSILSPCKKFISSEKDRCARCWTSKYTCLCQPWKLRDLEEHLDYTDRVYGPTMASKMQTKEYESSAEEGAKRKNVEPDNSDIEKKPKVEHQETNDEII